MSETVASYIARQRAVADRVRLEELALSPEARLELLARLMASVEPCGLEDALSEGDAAIRGRWQELRRRHGTNA